jgi:hypothetical protein
MPMIPGDLRATEISGLKKEIIFRVLSHKEKFPLAAVENLGQWTKVWPSWEWDLPLVDLGYLT